MEIVTTRYRTNILHNIPNGEIILNSYSCAFKNVILLQGFLFVSTEAVYFFSYFDDYDIASFFSFGRKDVTKIRIELSDIELVFKSKNDFISLFDNSVSFVLKSNPEEELFFTSFLDRNGAFDLIIK
jgi:hypothetical protein